MTQNCAKCYKQMSKYAARIRKKCVSFKTITEKNLIRCICFAFFFSKYFLYIFNDNFSTLAQVNNHQ